VRRVCEAPYQRPERVCRQSPNDASWSVGWLTVPHVFRYDAEEECACETVPGFDPVSGLDLETCGCMGGVPAASTLELTVEARASRVGAFQSECVAPFLIVIIAHTSYVITPAWLETRFNLLNSALIALVLYHAALKTRGNMNNVSVANVYDKFILLSYVALLAAYALTLWMMQLQEGKRQKHLCQRLYRSTRYVASIASLYLYIAGMCVFAGKRDPKVLFTCFAVLTFLLSLGAVCSRCGVADRICVRIDAQPREIEATARAAAGDARPNLYQLLVGLRRRGRERSPSISPSRTASEAGEAAGNASGEVLRVVTTRLPAASPGTNSVGKLGAMF